MKTATASTMVYGRRAYEGFAKAIGAKMGLKVQVEDGASACIDAAGVVRLPGMNTFQTQEEFAVTCGVVVHELAHQFYGSHKHIDPKRSRLEHDCLNAVLDVADETWVARWFEKGGNARPGDLLLTANVDALIRNFSAFADWTNAATHAWKVLCTGIMRARIMPAGKRVSFKNRRAVRRLAHHNDVNAKSLGVDGLKCYRLLGQAKLAKSGTGAPLAKRFRKLIGLAKQLADLLKPFSRPEDSQGAAVGTEAGADQGQPKAGLSIDGAVAVGAKQKPDGAVEAGAAAGAEQTTDAGSGLGGATGGDGRGGPRAFDADAFQLLAPAVDRIAQRIATDGDGITRTDGLAGGPALGQAHRLLTDGQCLARWNVAEHADGVAVSVLLDCSGSMDKILAQCAGIARAFALGMCEAGPVQCLIFGTRVEESRNFDTVRNLNATNTHLALERATEWLGTQRGDRWIVVITDGQPGDREATAAACDKAHAAGIHILAVGLNCNVEMPHTVAVTASDPAHLAIELQSAAQTIERN